MSKVTPFLASAFFDGGSVADGRRWLKGRSWCPPPSFVFFFFALGGFKRVVWRWRKKNAEVMRFPKLAELNGWKTVSSRRAWWPLLKTRNSSSIVIDENVCSHRWWCLASLESDAETEFISYLVTVRDAEMSSLLKSGCWQLDVNWEHHKAEVLASWC